jgi:hypothetical protein
MSRTLTDIKVGDRVWVSGKYSGQDKIKTVKRLTPKQIILDGKYEQYNRYHRGKPSRYDPYEPTYHGVGMSDGRIMRFATKVEYEKWDKEAAVSAEKALAATEKRKQKEAMRSELRGLFDGRMVSVSESCHTPNAEWDVGLKLTEGGVRKLAELITDLTPEQLPSWAND